jgi:hypothetical protein
MTCSERAIRHATSLAIDPRAAVRELHDVLGDPTPSLLVFFCSPRYDLDALAAALATTFAGTPTIGCTSAGQIEGAWFHRGGITAVAIASDAVQAQIHVITPLADAVAGAARIAGELRARVPLPAWWKTLGLYLIDGMSAQEERAASALADELVGIPLVGASAGDELRHAHTYVYAHGRFQRDAAVLATIDTWLPFRIFQFHHVEPATAPMVITAADPDRRVVDEIDGEPAARAYARAIGVAPEALDAAAVAAHPLVVPIRGRRLVRAVRAADRDGRLHLYGALERGVIVHVGRALEPVATAQRAFDALTDELGEVELVLGCDGVSRRLEAEAAGTADAIGAVYARGRVVGLSSYGEQLQGVHANHTFTGLGFGRAR